MLQHSKKGEKSQPHTFIDGVHVKISERYKPPRRVVLPVSCQNCSPGEALFSEYDFRLEENILNKLAEWKSARREQVERRKERLKTETKVCEEIEHFSNVSIGSSQNEATKHTQIQQSLNQKLTDSVLTPTCAKQISPSQKPVSSKFNLSDFESDNSSPFDNMELKTINDMEVLASILTTNNMEQSIQNNNNNNIIDKEIGKNCIVLNNKNTEWGFAPLNGYNSIGYPSSDYDNHHTVAPPHQKDFNQCGFYPLREHIQINNYGLNDFSNQFGAAASLERAAAHIKKLEPNDLGKNESCEVKETRCQEESSKSVPDIMLELEKEIKENREREEELERRNKLVYLKQTILSSNNKDKKQLPESSRKIHGGNALSKLPDPTSTLSPSSQKLVGYISEMGFPVSRVARACQLFDGNDKKAIILNGILQGEDVLLPRVPMIPADTSFEFKRLLIPVRLAFAMTINEGQGQSLQIIEFLVQVQSLEEKNYPGDLIEKALIINKFKLKESLKYLEAMVVLLDLGFDEEKAEEALIAANSDRDKALDLLIS